MTQHRQVLEVFFKQKPIESDQMVKMLALDFPDIFMILYNRTAQPEWLAEVKRLLLSDQKITAIKFLREKTGYGLLEAKRVCEEVNGDKQEYNLPLEQTYLDMAQKIKNS